MKPEMRKNFLGVFVAAAAALICAVIDYLTGDETRNGGPTDSPTWQ